MNNDKLYESVGLWYTSIIRLLFSILKLISKKLTSVDMLEKHYGHVVNRLVATQITKTRTRHNVKVSEKVYPF